jgi:hypothetical protein
MLHHFKAYISRINNMYSLLFLDKYFLRNRGRTRLGLMNHLVCTTFLFDLVKTLGFLKRFEHWQRRSECRIWGLIFQNFLEGSNPPPSP